MTSTSLLITPPTTAETGWMISKKGHRSRSSFLRPTSMTKSRDSNDRSMDECSVVASTSASNIPAKLANPFLGAKSKFQDASTSEFDLPPKWRSTSTSRPRWRIAKEEEEKRRKEKEAKETSDQNFIEEFKRNSRTLNAERGNSFRPMLSSRQRNNSTVTQRDNSTVTQRDNSTVTQGAAVSLDGFSEHVDYSVHEICEANPHTTGVRPADLSLGIPGCVEGEEEMHYKWQMSPTSKKWKRLPIDVEKPAAVVEEKPASLKRIDSKNKMISAFADILSDEIELDVQAPVTVSRRISALDDGVKKVKENEVKDKVQSVSLRMKPPVMKIVGDFASSTAFAVIARPKVTKKVPIHRSANQLAASGPTANQQAASGQSANQQSAKAPSTNEHTSRKSWMDSLRSQSSVVVKVGTTLLSVEKQKEVSSKKETNERTWSRSTSTKRKATVHVGSKAAPAVTVVVKPVAPIGAKPSAATLSLKEKSQPKVASKVVPKVVPEVVLRVDPSVVPKVIPMVVPMAVPKVKPTVEPKQKEVTKVVPKVDSNVVPKVVLKVDSKPKMVKGKLIVKEPLPDKKVITGVSKVIKPLVVKSKISPKPPQPSIATQIMKPVRPKLFKQAAVTEIIPKVENSTVTSTTPVKSRKLSQPRLIPQVTAVVPVVPAFLQQLRRQKAEKDARLGFIESVTGTTEATRPTTTTTTTAKVIKAVVSAQTSSTSIVPPIKQVGANEISPVHALSSRARNLSQPRLEADATTTTAAAVPEFMLQLRRMKAERAAAAITASVVSPHKPVVGGKPQVEPRKIVPKAKPDVTVAKPGSKPVAKPSILTSREEVLAEVAKPKPTADVDSCSKPTFAKPSDRKPVQLAKIDEHIPPKIVSVDGSGSRPIKGVKPPHLTNGAVDNKKVPKKVPDSTVTVRRSASTVTQRMPGAVKSIQGRPSSSSGRAPISGQTIALVGAVAKKTDVNYKKLLQSALDDCLFEREYSPKMVISVSEAETKSMKKGGFSVPKLRSMSTAVGRNGRETQEKSSITAPLRDALNRLTPKRRSASKVDVSKRSAVTAAIVTTLKRAPSLRVRRESPSPEHRRTIKEMAADLVARQKPPPEMTSSVVSDMSTASSICSLPPLMPRGRSGKPLKPPPRPTTLLLTNITPKVDPREYAFATGVNVVPDGSTNTKKSTSATKKVQPALRSSSTSITKTSQKITVKPFREDHIPQQPTRTTASHKVTSEPSTIKSARSQSSTISGGTGTTGTGTASAAKTSAVIKLTTKCPTSAVINEITHVKYEVARPAASREEQPTTVLFPPFRGRSCTPSALRARNSNNSLCLPRRSPSPALHSEPVALKEVPSHLVKRPRTKFFLLGFPKRISRQCFPYRKEKGFSFDITLVRVVRKGGIQEIFDGANIVLASIPIYVPDLPVERPPSPTFTTILLPLLPRPEPPQPLGNRAQATLANRKAQRQGSISSSSTSSSVKRPRVASQSTSRILRKRYK